MTDTIDRVVGFDTSPGAQGIPDFLPNGVPGGGSQVVFPPDTRQQITPYPYNAVGQVVSAFPNGKIYTGTGTLIDDRHVLTAAHNVYGSNIGGEATGIVFVPARDGDLMPFGFRQASEAFFPKEYAANEVPSPHESQGEAIDLEHYEFDYAVICLDEPLSLPSMPMLAATNAQLSKTTATIPGYPGDKPPGTMWSANGSVTPDNNGMLSYKIDTYKGESGSGLMMAFEQGIGQNIVGIHVAGSKKMQSNFAVRLTAERIEQIGRWMAS